MDYVVAVSVRICHGGTNKKNHLVRILMPPKIDVVLLLTGCRMLTSLIQIIIGLYYSCNSTKRILKKKVKNCSALIEVVSCEWMQSTLLQFANTLCCLNWIGSRVSSPILISQCPELHKVCQQKRHVGIFSTSTIYHCSQSASVVKRSIITTKKQVGGREKQILFHIISLQITELMNSQYCTYILIMESKLTQPNLLFEVYNIHSHIIIMKFSLFCQSLYIHLCI